VKTGDLICIDHSPQYTGIVIDMFKRPNGVLHHKIWWLHDPDQVSWRNYTNQNIEVISEKR